jgi:hypothetical protein
MSLGLLRFYTHLCLVAPKIEQGGCDLIPSHYMSRCRQRGIL